MEHGIRKQREKKISTFPFLLQTWLIFLARNFYAIFFFEKKTGWISLFYIPVFIYAHKKTKRNGCASSFLSFFLRGTKKYIRCMHSSLDRSILLMVYFSMMTMIMIIITIMIIIILIGERAEEDCARRTKNKIKWQRRRHSRLWLEYHISSKYVYFLEFRRKKRKISALSWGHLPQTRLVLSVTIIIIICRCHWFYWRQVRNRKVVIFFPE